MRVELFKGKGIQPYYLRLRAANGKVLAVSEGYMTRWNAKRAARRNFGGIPMIEVDV